MSEAHKTSLGHRMLEGIHFNLLGQAAVFAVNLAITPVVVRRLGPGGYAVYTLMWTLVGYLMMLTLGTGNAVQKYVAQFRSHKGRTPLGPLLRATLAFQLIMSALGALALLFCRGWIAGHWLHASGSLLADLPRVFACVAVATPAYFLLQFCLCVLYGEQSFDSYNLIQALQSSVVALGAAFLLTRDFGLREIAVLFAAAHALLAAAALWKIRRSFARPQSPFKGELAEFSRFSAKSFFSQIMGVMIAQGDRIIIGSLLPLAQMGYYVIASSLAQKLTVVCGAVNSAAFPMITELHGLGERERLRRLYLKSTELTLFIILPITILALVLMPQFTTLWLGPDFSAASTWPFRLILVANLAYISTFIPNGVATGMGHPQIFAYCQAGKLILLFILWPITIARWGILGAAMGFTISDWIIAPLFIGYVHRRFLGIGWAAYWEEACWRPAAAGMGLAAAALFTHARIGSWADLLAYGAAGLALFAAAGYWVLDRDARTLLVSWLRAKGRLS